MKKMNILGILACIIVIVCVFLPWESVKVGEMSQSINGIPEGLGGKPGYLNIILAALGLIFIFINKKWSNIVALILGLCVVAWMFRNYNMYNKDVSSANELMAGAASLGIGLWLSIAGGVLMVVGAIMGMRNKPAA